jgi:hypothetical protein
MKLFAGCSFSGMASGSRGNLSLMKYADWVVRELGVATFVGLLFRTRNAALSSGLCEVSCYSKVMTTFPRACPPPKYRIASGTSLNL